MSVVYEQNAILFHIWKENISLEQRDRNISLRDWNGKGTHQVFLPASKYV